MSTWNGIGTKYLGFGYKQPDGSHNATEWFVLNLMPIIPLRRYQLEVGKTRYASGAVGSTLTTEYLVLGRTRLRPLEVLATYLTWWIVVPGIALAPLVAASQLTAGDGSQSGVLVVFGLVWLLAFPITLMVVSKRARGLPR